MHRLIDDLVTYSRVDTHADHSPAPVAVGDVVGAVLGDLRAKVTETGAEIHVDSLPTVVADRTQLAKVFANLLSNALIYVPDGRVPSVQVSADRLDGAWQFTVADNGIGVDSWHREQIFRVFQRVHPNQYSGSGIGLAVCKKIVERHGGRIWVEDNPSAAPGSGSPSPTTAWRDGPRSGCDLGAVQGGRRGCCTLSGEPATAARRWVGT